MLNICRKSSIYQNSEINLSFVNASYFERNLFILFYLNKNKYVSPAPRPLLSRPLLYFIIYIFDKNLGFDGGRDGGLDGGFDGAIDAALDGVCKSVLKY